LPITLHPPEHFATTSREVYSQLIQCCTGHTFLGEYYTEFIPSWDVSCRCGHNIQPHSHILVNCPLFAHAQQYLTAESEDLVIVDPLGTKTGIQAIVEFLVCSSTFKKYLPPA
ncbi:hypothetical protein J3A83DRAFT_4083764, partial [Scleroderma citrinum]